MTDVYRIAFYDDFSCAAASCHETCCRSFCIYVDDASYAAYRREKGLLGLKLRLAIRGKEDHLINASGLHCIFHTREGLCELQQKRGASFMPVSCQVYPRRHRDMGYAAEECLDLSCEEAARLLLTAKEGPYFVHLRQEITYGRHGNNDDRDFFDGLIRSRDLLCALFDGGGVEEAFRMALSYATHWQARCARGEDPFSGTPDSIETEALFPVPVGLLNEWMNGCIYAEDLKRRLPMLYRVFHRYMKQFDRLTETQGQLLMDTIMRDFFAAGYVGEEKYRRYFVYFLCRFYMEIYEDYSFVRHVREAVMHTNMILLLDALWADEHHKLSIRTQARLIAVYEKRVFHNEGVEKKMYGKWQEQEAT